MRWSIRAKLTAIVLAVLLPLVAGALLKFWSETRESHERSQERLLVTAQAAARQLDEILSGQVENLEVLAAGQSIDRFHDEDLAALAARVRARHPFVRAFLTATADGRILATSLPRAGAVATALGSWPLFQEAQRSGESQVGAPQPSVIDGRPVVPLLMVTADAAPGRRGAFVVELDPGALSAFLEGVPVARAGLLVATAEGLVVMRAGTATWPEAAAAPASPDTVRLARQGGGAARWQAADGSLHLVAAASLTRAPWVVIAGVPGTLVGDRAAGRLRTNLIGLAVVTLVALGLAWGVGRQMHRSVSALIAGAREMAAGRPSAIVVRGSDELAELATQWNRAMQGRQDVEAQLETRQRRLEALARVNLSLSQELDPEPLLQQITDALAHLTGASTVVLWEARVAEGRLVRRAWTAEASVGTVDLPVELTFEQGATGWIATHRRALFIEDITTDPRVMALSWARRSDLLVLAGAPVQAGDELVGVLTLNLKRGRTLGADERDLLLSFASQAAVAIRNAKLFADARARREAAEAVAGLGRVLAQALDPEEVAPRVADGVRALLGAQAAGLYRLDPDTGDLLPMAQSGGMGADGAPVVFPRGTGVAGVAARERRPVATPNVLTDERVVLTAEARERISRASYRSVLAVPLVVKDTVVGALAVGDREGRAFGEDEIRLAQTVADQAGLALENARLFAEATRRRREAEEQARLARMFTESLDVAEVGRRIVESVLPLFRAVSSGLFLINRDGALRAAAWGGRAREHFEPDQVFPPGVGIMGQVASGGRPAWVRDVLAGPLLTDDMRRRNEAAGNRAALAVPMRVKGEIVGVLSIADAEVRDFSAEETGLLEAFAAQGAVALENARLFASAERRRREAEELARVGRALAQTLDPDGVARQIVESVQIVFGVRVAVLFRLEAGSGDLVTWVSTGPLRDPMGSGLVYPSGTGLVGLALQARRPVASPDVLGDPAIPLPPEARAWLEREGVTTGLAVPLMIHERVIGVLSLGDVPGRRFDESEVTLAQAFADEAALVLENARLYVEATRRRREAEELAGLARTLTESLDVGHVGQRIVDSVVLLFHARFARLRVRQPDGSLRPLAWAGTTEDYGAHDTPFPAGMGMAGLAVAEGRAVRCADALADPRMGFTAEVRDVLTKSGARALAGVPLRVRGEIIGSLTMGDQLGRVFSDDEMVLLETFADQAALALDNARLYEQTRQRLRQVDSLREVVEQILGSFSLEGRLDVVARKAAELLDADRATVALCVEGEEALVIRAGYGLFPEELGRKIPMGEGGVGVAAARREGILVNDYASWPHRQPLLVARGEVTVLQGVVACPLLIRDQVIGALSVGTYTSARRFTEGDLERLASLAAPAALAIEHSRLYEQLGERLRELQDTQAQLVQAAKLSAVGQLVSGVAHELNNPLSVVLGHGQLLLAKPLPPELRRPVELIVSQGDRMAKIVQGLLLFSRQRQPTRGPVDVVKVLEQILELRAAQLRVSGIRVEVEHAAGGARAAGDAHQLQQVFLNLLLNAEQAILGGGTGNCIRVRTWTREAADGCWIVAEIADNGPGIPPDVLPRIFDPFFTTKPVGKGTGLGLSVSYGIVEQHGGRLTARSGPGETVFTVELPAQGAGAGPGAGAAPAAQVRPVGAGRQALVVEDEPHLVELVSTLLRQTGWRVDVSEGGRPALERVRGTDYDLIVSDMRMPDGGGEEFYRAARAARPELARRFLFVTGDTANPEAWKFLEETQAPVLEKPFTAEALLREVERLLA